MQLPTEDKSYKLRNDMLDELVVLLGGRVAESLVLDDISTGASNDIERASDIARKMVTKYGMSDTLGPISYGSGNEEVFLGRDYNHTQNFSESIASKIDTEVSGIISRAYDRTKDLLNTHLDKLHLIAQYLFEHEKMDGARFIEYMEKGKSADAVDLLTGEPVPEN